MTPAEFVAKWSTSPAALLNEEQGAQSYFLDLCAVLDVPLPGTIAGYRFEEKAKMIGARTGFADVFYPNRFVWENKKPDGNLDEALQQLVMYSYSLNNPPLLVVCDRKRIHVHTRFTGHPSGQFLFTLEDMLNPTARALLRRVWTDVEHFRPRETCRGITERAAQTFAIIAEGMRKRGCVAEEVAHFLNQCVFCFFAESIGILPGNIFVNLLSNRHIDSKKLRIALQNLFTTMHDGGMYGRDDIPWFNGGLFRVVKVPELTILEMTELRKAAVMNWSAIDASILGTLFERGLDPAKRSQLGAHYTDPATILRITEPVLSRPLLQKWELAMQEIRALLAKSKKNNDKHHKAASEVFAHWLEHIKTFRLLDPACGSGNFLFMGLKALKDLELQTHLDAAALGLPRPPDLVTGPHNVLGIEINEYAAELARVTVWIGELQWRLEHKYPLRMDPILEPLDLIDQRDALLTIDPRTGEATEATWPKADIVMSNPPFLGGKKFVTELGETNAMQLRTVYKNRVPGLADLVTYWFFKANAQIMAGQLSAAGLVCTNSLRDGFGNAVVRRLNASTPIYDAWSDNEWVNEGAAVRVSIMAFANPTMASGFDKRLNGEPVDVITADLTSSSTDMTMVKPLPSNMGAAFQGTTRSGAFDIAGDVARQWLMHINPNGKPNADVIRPWTNGFDITRRPSDTWIIDFGTGMPEDEAMLYETPFIHCKQFIKPARINNRNPRLVEQFWHYDGVRVGMRKAITPLHRYIATTITAKYRTFVWLHPSKLADATVVAIARSDDATFGILQSRFHVLWAMSTGSWLGAGNHSRYVTGACFHTFPFPENFTPADTAHQHVENVGGVLIPAGLEGEVDVTPPEKSSTKKRRKVPEMPVEPAFLAPKVIAYHIAKVAHRLNELRENWLNPPEWTQKVPEIIPHGMTESPYPDRIEPRPALEETVLKNLQERTLTHLYNFRPPWLEHLHEQLDIAVAHAYGWHDYTPQMSDSEVLARLLQLNISQQVP